MVTTNKQIFKKKEPTTNFFDKELIFVSNNIVMKNYFLFLLITLGLASCDRSVEKIPSYVYIKPFQLTTKTEEGSASASLPEAWVYVNEEFIGAYSLPAQVPFLSDGQARITVFPGVHENGLAEYPNIYPFYQEFDVKKTIAPSKVDTIVPKLRYYDNTKFALLENFESGNMFTYQYSKLGGKFSRTLDKPFEGTACGIIKLQTKDTTLATTVASTLLMKNQLNDAAPAYVELDYNSDIDLEVGLLANEKFSGQEIYESIAFFKGKKEWRKIYVNLDAAVNESKFSSYRLTFSAALPFTNGKYEKPTGEVKIDNVKVVYR